MARAIWTGAIRFGLVNVPVRLSTAVSSREVRFHLLHAPDGGRIQFKRTCAIDGAPVPNEEIVKGYEVTRGRYVTVDPAELDALDPEATHAIEIKEFVELSDIDPIFYDSTYRVFPDKGAAHAFDLLVAALRESGKVAIARVVLRTKGYLCAVRASGGGLLLSTMVHADEIVPVDQGEDAGAPVDAKELQLALQLVDALSAKFDPSRYRDEHRDRVLALIQGKVEGKEIVAPPTPREAAPVIDLRDALAKSLAAQQRPERGERRTEAAARRTSKRPRRTSR